MTFSVDNSILINERKVILMLVQLLDAIDSENYEVIKQILDEMEGKDK